MEVLLTKANDINWFQFKTFDSLEDLFSYINKYNYPLVLRANDFYENINSKKEKRYRISTLQDLAKFWNTSLKNAQKINDIQWEVQIYDCDF